MTLRFHIKNQRSGGGPREGGNSRRGGKDSPVKKKQNHSTSKEMVGGETGRRKVTVRPSAKKPNKTRQLTNFRRSPMVRGVPRKPQKWRANPRRSAGKELPKEKNRKKEDTKKRVCTTTHQSRRAHKEFPHSQKKKKNKKWIGLSGTGTRCFQR